MKTDYKIPPVAKFPFEALLSGKESIPIIIGKDNVENPVIIDLAQAPYLLIAGTPGTGKTECFNTLIASLQIKFSPDELKLLLIDSKVTAFDQFKRVPHLLMPPFNDPDKALSVLNQIADEIDQRYKIMRDAGAKNITEFNSGTGNAMPYIVLIIDELADLVTDRMHDVECAIARIAQKGRAAGIHIVISTQCISKDVITLSLKSYFPSRICFKMLTGEDSLRVLDEKGAETLQGNGDMLLQYSLYAKNKRVQGISLSVDEIDKIVNFARKL